MTSVGGCREIAPHKGECNVSQYKCRKCGQEAYSKCVNQRNVFPEDQMAAMLSHVLSLRVDEHVYDPERYDPPVGGSKYYVVVLEYKYVPDFDEKDAADHARDLFVKSLPEYAKVLPRMMCDCEWELIEGDAKNGTECMFGCCHVKK
jgi:hypothetical protein